MNASQQETAQKLREAMRGLRACIPKASPDERKVIVASLNDLRAIHASVSAMDYMDEMAESPAAEAAEDEVPVCEMPPDEEEVTDEDVVTFVPADGMDDDEELAISGLALAAKALRALSAADDAPAEEAPADEAPAEEAPADEAPAADEEAPADDGAAADEAPPADEEAPAECNCPPADDSEILSDDDLAELEEAGIIDASFRKARAVAAKATTTKKNAADTLRAQLQAASARLDEALGSKKKSPATPVKAQAKTPVKKPTMTSTVKTKR